MCLSLSSCFLFPSPFGVYERVSFLILSKRVRPTSTATTLDARRLPDRLRDCALVESIHPKRQQCLQSDPMPIDIR